MGELNSTNNSELQQAKNSKKMEDKRAENNEKDSTDENLLLAIDGAKIKFNSHMGEFKVLTDVPTTQDKLTGTIVEKQIPNFTFYDGFQMISLTQWQDFGTAKVQDNEVLLKKSFLPGVGKMPGNIPPETGKIEFVDSGQINVPESLNTAGAPIPEPKDHDTEYIYYTKDGYYLGGKETSNKIYLSTQEEYNKAKKDKKWSLINKSENLLKEKERIISNNEFCNNAYLVHHEASLTGNKQTALWIAHTVNNALGSKHRRGKNTFNELFKTGYSSVSSADKTKIIKANNNSQNEIFARYAVIDVLIGSYDPTGKAYFWDGLDLFTRKGELDHPKFKQYKSVTIGSNELRLAIIFWSDSNNKRKVNPNSVINTIFIEEYKLKKVTNGAISNINGYFTGARTDSQNNHRVTEDLYSTGFHGGTMFWTTRN